MKNILLLISYSMLLAGCHLKSMTLEQLKKAEWEKISPGISYISLETGSPDSARPYQYRVKYVFRQDGTVEVPTENKFQSYLDTSIEMTVKDRLGNSKRGYIKLNMQDLVLSTSPAITIYLGEYDSSKLEMDLAALRSIKGVKLVNYKSKEEALQNYLQDSNEDIKMILAENPLPRSIEITVDPDVIKSEDFKYLKEKVQDQLGPGQELHTAFDLVKRLANREVIIEYSR